MKATNLLSHSQGQRTCVACLACTILSISLIYIVSVTRSLVITGLAWISVFSLFAMVSAIVALNASPSSNKRYTFGTVRGPVLAVFSTSVLAQLSAVFLTKEAFERLLEVGHHHGSNAASPDYFLPAAFASTASLLIAAYAIQNQPFSYVLKHAQSSVIQEHAADISAALCYIIPGLSRLLLPRINPLTLLALISSASCLATHWFLPEFWWFDAVAALVLSFTMFASMMPLSTYTGRILLQTTPPHVANMIDRCISEASTVEGVLELRNGHFWQLDFNTIAGTVDVRVRRDANEQIVLQLVRDKLCSVVNICTIQVLKDQTSTWNYQRISNTYFQPQIHHHNILHSNTVDLNGHGHSHNHAEVSHHSHDHSNSHGHGHSH